MNGARIKAKENEARIKAKENKEQRIYKSSFLICGFVAKLEIKFSNCFPNPIEIFSLLHRQLYRNCVPCI